MANYADAGSTPAQIMTIAQLSQWKVDHERDDTRQFTSIDRKLNWLIGGAFSVAVAIAGALAHEVIASDQARLDRLEASQSPAAMSPAQHARP
jgi:hypothetical protein